MQEAGQVVVDVRMGLFEFSEKVARPEEMWVPIRDKMPDVFDGTPEMRRIDDIPANSDTWVMKLSSAGVFSLEVARYRADFCMAGRGRQTVEDVRKDFVAHAESIVEMFAGQHAGRVGLVARVFYQDDAPHAMAAKVLRTVAADDKVASVLVQYVLHTRFAELEVNDNTSIDSNTVAMVAGTGSDLKGVQVTRDLNIAKGMLWASTQENVASFLNWAFDTLGLDKVEGALWTTK